MFVNRTLHGAQTEYYYRSWKKLHITEQYGLLSFNALYIGGSQEFL
jgi:hypothetical protein